MYCFRYEKVPVIPFTDMKTEKKSSNVSDFNQWQKSIAIYANKMKKNKIQSY
jgi:hypothetical protein